jgi:hypothetical protein
MQGTQFAQFSAEVLRRGAAAVLPQHLPDHWLDALLEEAELFAPEEWDPQEDDRVHECCAGLLGAVLVVLMEQQGPPRLAGSGRQHAHEPPPLLYSGPRSRTGQP